MRITTLGTSHGDPTATSFQSSILLETGGGFYLFDAGEPVSALLIALAEAIAVLMLRMVSKETFR